MGKQSLWNDWIGNNTLKCTFYVVIQGLKLQDTWLQSVFSSWLGRLPEDKGTSSSLYQGSSPKGWAPLQFVWLELGAFHDSWSQFTSHKVFTQTLQWLHFIKWNYTRAHKRSLKSPSRRDTYCPERKIEVVPHWRWKSFYQPIFWNLRSFSNSLHKNLRSIIQEIPSFATWSLGGRLVPWNEDSI